MVKYEIRLARIDEKGILVDLLNKVTLHLHKNGINQWSYPCDDREIYEDLKNRFVYVLTVNKSIVGTFSIKDTDDIITPLIEQKKQYIYRIAISPEYFGKNLGLNVVNYAMELSKRMKKSLYLDCWAGNIKLKEFYSNAGFEFLGNVPEDDYMISVFKYDGGVSE